MGPTPPTAAGWPARRGSTLPAQALPRAPLQQAEDAAEHLQRTPRTDCPASLLAPAVPQRSTSLQGGGGDISSQRLLAWRYLPNPAKAPRERQPGQGATLNARRLLLSGRSGARCYSCFSSFPPPPRVRRHRSSLRPFYCQVPFENKVVTSHSVGSIFSDAGTDNQQVLSLSTARSTRL